MSTLQFNGTASDYVEIADSADFSVATTNSLSVSAWMRPDVLTFPNYESTGYVHWLGKGGPASRNGRSGCTTRRLPMFRPGQTGSVSTFSIRQATKGREAISRNPCRPVNGSTSLALPTGKTAPSRESLPGSRTASFMRDLNWRRHAPQKKPQDHFAPAELMQPPDAVGRISCDAPTAVCQV
jgi:hypothetical protein